MIFEPKHTFSSVAKELVDGLESGSIPIPQEERTAPSSEEAMPCETVRPKVFLSYAREDRSAARRLYHALSKSGLDIWFDEQRLVGGERWSTAINDAIKNSDFFVAVLSDASVSKRGYVQKEIREALRVLETLPEGRIFIVPVRLSECRPSFELLREIHWIDLFEDWDLGIQQILKAVSPEHLKREGPVGETPFERELAAAPEPLLAQEAKKVRLTELIHESLGAFERIAEQRDISIRLRDESKGASITVDPVALKLIFYNLLHNAIKYSWASERGPNWVSVVTDVKERQTTIKVENFGVPIAKDEIENGLIFRPGYRSRYSSDMTGTGLGLYVARELSGRLGGDITVESRPLSGRTGPPHYDQPYVTTFEIRLPLEEVRDKS